MRDYFFGDIGAPGDGIEGHVYDAIPVSQHKQIHEHMPDSRIRRYRRIEYLGKDFCEHSHTLHPLSETVKDILSPMFPVSEYCVTDSRSCRPESRLRV